MRCYYYLQWAKVERKFFFYLNSAWFWMLIFLFCWLAACSRVLECLTAGVHVKNLFLDGMMSTYHIYVSYVIIYVCIIHMWKPGSITGLIS